MFLLDGLAFSMLNLGHYFCHQFSQVIVGRKLGPTALASYAIMIQWYILLNGLISMVGRPLWPALTDAIARRDYAWARSVYRKLLRYSCAYGLVVGVAFLTLGRPLAHMLYHGHIHLRTSLLLFMGLYFVLIMWEYVQTTMLIGLNRIWVPSVSIVSRGILILIIGPPLMRYMGEAGMALALCLSILITSAWFCPLMVRKYLRLSERYQTAPL
jgi:O-antigen/teichoic acid export membrane protein